MKVTFLRLMFPKFSATPSTIGAARLQSEMIKLSIEFGLLPLASPIKNAGARSLPVQ